MPPSFFRCLLLAPCIIDGPKRVFGVPRQSPTRPNCPLGLPASSPSFKLQPPPPYGRLIRISISMVFTMEGLIEHDVNTFRNVESTLGG